MKNNQETHLPQHTKKNKGKSGNNRVEQLKTKDEKKILTATRENRILNTEKQRFKIREGSM